MKKTDGLISSYTPFYHFTLLSDTQQLIHCASQHPKQCTLLPAKSDRAFRNGGEYLIALPQVLWWHFIIRLTRHVIMT